MARKTYRHICAQCGEPFTAARADATFCSTACRVARHRGVPAPKIPERVVTDEMRHDAARLVHLMAWAQSIGLIVRYAVYDSEEEIQWGDDADSVDALEDQLVAVAGEDFTQRLHEELSEEDRERAFEWWDQRDHARRASAAAPQSPQG